MNGRCTNALYETIQLKNDMHGRFDVSYTSETNSWFPIVGPGGTAGTRADREALPKEYQGEVCAREMKKLASSEIDE